MKPNLKRSLLLLLGGLLLVTPLVSQAAVDYVGQMYPGPNTDATERTVTEGDPSGLDVYIQAYKGGTTDSPGQGPGIECFISWDDPATDPDWNDIPTIYNKDIGNNDEYVGTIPTDSLAPGNYEYIGYCTDDGGTTKEYPENEGGNGTLIIEPFSLDGDPPTQAMHSMQPPAGDTTTRAPGDTTPFEITVDFYQSGQTDAFGEGTNASCVVHWDGADGAADGNFGDTAMSYKEDSVDGYSDRYSVALDISALPEGSYGYTTRCDLGGAPYWYGDYNTPADGTLFIGTVSPPDITNMQPPAGDTTIIPEGDTDDFTLSVDFFLAGVTDADANAAGAGVTCDLWWDGYEGVPNNDWEASAMTYAGADNNGYDVFEYTVSSAGTTLPTGDYGYTSRCTYDGTVYWYGDYNDPSDGTLRVFAPSSLDNQSALWVDRDTLAWNPAFQASITTYELHTASDGNLAVPPTSGSGTPLTAGSVLTATSYDKFPNADGYTAFTFNTSPTDAELRDILRGETAIAGYDSNGDLAETTGVQLQGVLDAFYPRATVETYLGSQNLGVNYNGDGTQTLHLWAPTAQSVSVLNYGNDCSATPIAHTMTFDEASGVWSYTTSTDWNYDYYRYQVDVYSPYTGVVEANTVTDPYSVSLSVNTFDVNNEQPLNDQCSQVIDLLNDPVLKPSGWDTLSKPALPAPEDISVYELHVRDFSVFDTSVTDADHRGTYKAFTYDGNGNPLSDGMSHLIDLANAGLTHIHLLPVADSGIMVEDANQRAEPDFNALETAVSGDPATNDAADAAANTRYTDGFNWGYETQHFAAPEGAYSTDPDSPFRVLEFREMVQSLNQNDLRVVIDVVYNHAYRAEQDSGSVLDKIVPGYYQRLDASGNVMTSSCCPDTASEFDMMEKLITDTVQIWAEAYKVDGFRFDLMNLHTVDNIQSVRSTLDALPGGEDIYVYGEGWDFGSLKDKGFDDRHATQLNMAGTGIGTFNDRIRDAAHGGFNDKPEQGFINGQFYDPNGIGSSNQGTLRYSQDRLRIGLAGNLQTFSFTDQADNSVTGASLDGTGYTLDPQEAVNYVTKHDNETLFDLNAYKLPRGDDGTNVTSMADRVRAHNMGLSVIGLGQGIPFFHAGSDMLRSKSMDRNSYDSGDWFNRLDFTYNDNNFPAGLPPAWDNSSRYSTITPLLQDSNLYAGNSDIVDSVDHFQEMLQIRYSSPLFRLTTDDDVNSRVQFHNTGSSQLDGLIVMSLSDQPDPDLDPNNESIWVLFNANDEQQTFTVNELVNDVSVALHPVQQGSADPVVQTASFDSSTGTFTIPARTTAVFESQAVIDSPSSLDYVGRMFPRGGQSNAYNVGESATHEVYVQVYEQGVTEPDGPGDDISCYISYGPVDGTQTDVQMTYNTDTGFNDNNDEYVGTIDISALAAGTYSVDTYCQLDGETKKKWRQDDLSLNPVDEGFSIISILPGSTPPPDDTFVHLFEWKWTDIENECPYLADVGYDAVQVSPPQEHAVLDTVDTDPWWTRYQPVSYTLQGRSGSPAEFQSMVNACNTVGVDIYVDAVINHTTGQNVESTGSAGTVYNHYNHPGLYDSDDFRYCGTNSGASDDTIHDITDYSRRYEVQECELLDLADLDTDDPDVQTTLGAYLQSLVDMGVAGFRIDASKHMFTHDITEILGTVTGDFYVFQEVIGAAGEPVKPNEYVINGDVTEFGYSNAIGSAFNCGGNLAGLENIGNGLLRSDDAVVFVDNHDNQRGHGAGGACVLDHTDGDDKYNLGNVFMLAYPYGYPKVMSSYVWDYTPTLPNIENADSNPPPTAPVYDGNGNVTGCNGTDWVCEHRRQPIAGMVGFRAATSGQPLTDWSTISTDQVAFGRGSQGFVALNNTGSALTGQTFNTSLTVGTYCDVITGGVSNDGLSCVGTSVSVNTNGEIIGTDVPAMSAIAIHANARLSINNTDVNGDLLVTPQDAVYVINRIGQDDPSADVNGDTVVNDADVQAVIADIGTDNRPD